MKGCLTAYRSGLIDSYSTGYYTIHENVEEMKSYLFKTVSEKILNSFKVFP